MCFGLHFFTGLTNKGTLTVVLFVDYLGLFYQVMGLAGTIFAD